MLRFELTSDPTVFHITDDMDFNYADFFRVKNIKCKYNQDLELEVAIYNLYVNSNGEVAKTLATKKMLKLNREKMNAEDYKSEMEKLLLDIPMRFHDFVYEMIEISFDFVNQAYNIYEVKISVASRIVEELKKALLK